jgi:hypothetical protein
MPLTLYGILMASASLFLVSYFLIRKPRDSRIMLRMGRQLRKQLHVEEELKLALLKLRSKA